MKTGVASTLLLAFAMASTALAVTITVNSSPAHTVSPTLCALGRADTRIQSGDGGLYAEMLQNRAFQQVTPGTSAALNSWASLNGGTIAVVADSTPVSKALPNSLQLKVPTGKMGAVGFTNSGFFGIKVDSSWTYTASFFFRFPTASSFTGAATVGLRSSTGSTLASATTTISGSQTTWKEVTVTLKPSASASDLQNTFFVSLDGAAASGQTVNFAMFSLFPPTFKGRKNGMRMDIAQALADMGPRFFRFPGGNNLGQSFAQRWQWNATVGPLTERPGRLGDWGYVNTDGLGMLEYLEFFEDVGMEPIMAVWSGKCLFARVWAAANLQPYIQQAIDQINFVVGDPSKSAAAALRSSLGHPEPFTLNYVEIGNEDFISSLASSTYTYRWTAIFNALHAEFPNIRFLATTDVGSPTLSPKPPSYDVHVYQTPTWFFQNAFFYDSFARDGTTYFEGEYAAISTNSSNIFGSPSTGRLTFPTMASSSGEAAFMTGLERNSDIVFAASYAPLLQHIESTQWTPDLISYDSGAVIKSTSYYAQQLFATNIGDVYLSSTLPTNGNSLQWSITQDSSTGDAFIKVANAGSSAQSLTFDLSQFATVASSGTLKLLTGNQTASNTPTAPNTITPKTSTIATGKSFAYSAPAFSVSVITVNLK
ncbi:glycoside hydrolase family 51 protein [Epithele typhae]|uniref:glycoside hydrolase family 51 protein n=1 Tax=Epithele typhae TaxID=378194 RepID=UPI0020074A4B|nr:glycoside hydrolase family 51 protein [Epithele typhae]KAH9941309.1 glycoside hydrolase family 51 protein [Epithele typhae]